MLTETEIAEIKKEVLQSTPSIANQIQNLLTIKQLTNEQHQ